MSTEYKEMEQEYIASHFKKRIIYLMNYFGYTKAETARKANIARSTFYRYLYGDIPPAEHSLTKIANVFHSDRDIFTHGEFYIREFNTDLMVYNRKHCLWNDNDNGFNVLKETVSPLYKFPFDLDSNHSDSNANNLSELIESSPKPIVVDEPFDNTKNTSGNVDNQSYKKIYGDSGSNRIIFYSDDQFYELLNNLIEVFEQNPDDKGKIFYKTYSFTKELNKEYPNLEKEQKKTIKNT